jgi:HK97 family phage major capsid protein/HK97 family phage prohead protease
MKIKGDGSISGRAYSVLDFGKSIKEDDNNYIIEGIASTPTTDRMGDQVVSTGAKFKLPMPLLWQHDSHKPVGSVTFAAPTAKGIPFKATLPKITEPGTLKDRVDEAIHSIKYKLVAAVSIGFNAIKGGYEYLEGNAGIKFNEWEWLELSLVTIPANAEATLKQIKSIDREFLAATGKLELEEEDLPTPSGVSDKKASKPIFLNPEGKVTMKTTAEKIAEFKAKRDEKMAEISAIMTKATDEGRTLDEHEQEQYAEITAEIKGIDSHVVRLEEMEALTVKTAKPVVATAADAAPEASGIQIRDGASIQVVRNQPKGTSFTRFVMALTRAKGDAFSAAEQAKRWNDSTPEVARVLRAAADAGTTTDADWASKLVDYTTMAGEFIELLRPMTILGKFGSNGIPALRKVPFNIRMATQTGGGQYGWVGEGKATSVGELSIGEVLLKWAKASGIIVVTDELMRMSTPAVEAIVRQDMLGGMAQFSDLSFVDPTLAAVSDVSPASITFGATNVVPSTGTDADALRTDIKTLLSAFFAANLAPTSGVFIMSNRQALGISLMRNALGNKEYPDMTPLGGTLEGFPVITSETVPDGSDGGMIIFVNANDIFFSDDGPVTIDASREASLQMNTTPDEPTGASTVLTSLWQRRLIALRAERYMNWKLRRAAAVGYIESTNYA